MTDPRGILQVIRERLGRTVIYPKATGASKELAVVNDCGEVNCVVELHIGERDGDHVLQCKQVHLDYVETQELVKLLLQALRKWDAEQERYEDH